jgi:hypothetical protein
MKDRFLKPTDSEGQNGTSELLKIAAIRYDCGTQSRAAINEEVVAEYAERMVNGDRFPALEVFHDGSAYYLADGFHRIMAAIRNGFLDFECRVRPGTKADALRFSLGANVKHGLKRTNADKRHSVELALHEWPQLSDRSIAEICAVGNALVGDVRRQVFESNTCDSQPRLGRDGKQYATRKTSVHRAETSPEPELHVNGTSKFLSTATDEEPTRIKTYDEEIAEMELTVGEPSEPRARIRYHLELIIADAKYLLERLDSNSVEREELEHAALEQALSSRLLSEFAAKRFAVTAHN